MNMDSCQEGSIIHDIGLHDLSLSYIIDDTDFGKAFDIENTKYKLFMHVQPTIPSNFWGELQWNIFITHDSLLLLNHKSNIRWSSRGKPLKSKRWEKVYKKK